jgi:glycosyltransferase involved in cell wall biosynthesis
MAGRALVLTPRFPLPLRSGTLIREYHVLAGIAERYDTTLVSLVQNPPAEAGATRLREELGVEVRTVAAERSKPAAAVRTVFTGRPYRVNKFSVPAFETAVRDTLGTGFDLVWANFLNTVTALPPDAEPGPAVVLDEHNADVRYWASFASGGLPERAFARWNVALVRRLQSRLADRIDALVSVSEADAAEGRAWLGERPIHVLPNGVDTDRFTPTAPATGAPERVLFVGSLDVRMNEEAVEWFVNEAWTAVRKRRPTATFRIVGANPTDRVRALTDAPGVELVGPVSSVVPHYDDAAVVVVPSAFGGGSKLKLLEALAMERPVVTTSRGSVGVPIDDGDHALIRNRGEGFATAVAALLAEPERRTALGNRGRRFVAERYAWEALVDEGLDRVLGSLHEESRLNGTNG